MTAITLELTGSEKENLAAVWIVSDDGARTYRWGVNGSAKLNGTINVEPGAYNAFYSFNSGSNPAGAVQIPDEEATTIDIEVD